MTTHKSAAFATRQNVDERARLLLLINANWTTQAVSTAIQLGLPELLREGPQTADTLAQAAHCHGPSLARLLRALTSIDVLTESAKGRFALTEVGALLRADVPNSLAAWGEFCGTRSWSSWGLLVQSVRTGESVRKQMSGIDGFHHLDNDAQGASLFNRAMVDLTQPVALAVAKQVDFYGMRLIVDVGGGYGELIASILCQHPSLHGILFDLSHATTTVSDRLTATGVEGRCKRITGSFFNAIPDGADAYLLKSVLHDWDDHQAVRILENCRRAMTPHAKLFVIERIAPQHFSNSPHDQDIARSDLNMLVGTGGHERTESQYMQLLRAAKLRLTHSLQLTGPYCVIECATV